MAEARRYQVQNEAANRLITELIDVAGVPPDRRGYVQHMLTTVLKLHEDGTPTGDLKVTNAALKELRYAYKVFAPYRQMRKVTVFGSARLLSDNPAYQQAVEFSRRIAEAGYLVITGAASGIGFATASRLQTEGWDVVAIDRDPAPFDDAHVLDLRDLAAIGPTFERIGPIDVVVPTRLVRRETTGPPRQVPIPAPRRVSTPLT